MTAPIRKLAEEIASIMLPEGWQDGGMIIENARGYLRNEIEARLRSALPELSGLLGELAVKDQLLSYALGVVSQIRRGYGLGEAIAAEERLSSALSSDAGRLAAELIRAAVEKRDAAKAHIQTQVGPVNRNAEAAAFDRRGYAERRYEEALSALLQAFPRIREEVERG